jgi:hypothetical protein
MLFLTAANFEVLCAADRELLGTAIMLYAHGALVKSALRC